MKKILFVISSLGSGGAERVVSTLANEMNKQRYSVSIMTTNNDHLVYKLAENIHVRMLMCDKDTECSPVKRLGLRLKKIREGILAETPDVVISFMSTTNIDVCFAMTGLHIPLIVSERNDPSIDPKSKAKQFLRKIAYLKPSYFVFQTPDAKSYFSKRIQNKSSIILNPLAENIPEPYVGEREKRIVSVGRLNKQKNYPMLLKGFAEFHNGYPDYKLEIYGEGELLGSLQKECVDLGISESVVFCGFCKDVHERIKKAAMFVMTSDFEGMPNALIEAMAMGLPCISTDCPCGGPRMLIRNEGNGILISLGASLELANAMRYLLQNFEEMKKISTGASMIRKMTDIEAITSQWVETIWKVLY